MKTLFVALIVIASCTPPIPIHETELIEPEIDSCAGMTLETLISEHTLTISVHSGSIVEAMTWRDGVYQRAPLDVLIDSSLSPRLERVEHGWCAIGPLVGHACLVALWQENTCFVVTNKAVEVRD